MSDADDPFRPDPEARQFTTRGLLVLAVLCALIAAATQLLELPRGAQVFLTFWWMALAAYLVFRIPYAIRYLLGRTTRWERLKARRAELVEMAEQKRKEFRESQQVEDATGDDSNTDT